MRVDLNPVPAVTEVTFLLDRSSSMGEVRNRVNVRDATIEAFNTYLYGLKDNPGAEIVFTLLQFDAYADAKASDLGSYCQVTKTFVHLPIAMVKRLDHDTFVPRGGTPLIEATYETIRGIERRVAAMPVKPKVVLCILTDGEENRSRADYSFPELKRLISQKTEEGWQFIFMGAGIDAYQQGERMGVSVRNTVSYDHANLENTRAAFRGTAASTTRYASGMASTAEYTSEEKRAAGDRFDPSAGSQAKTPPS